MGFRLTPRDNAFYEMFTEAGRNVAESADVLAGLLDPNANREAIAKELREREHIGAVWKFVERTPRAASASGRCAMSTSTSRRASSSGWWGSPGVASRRSATP